jgi:pimeloyl-ACP methyl ester carboxylesterase
VPEPLVPKLFVHGNPETSAVWEPLVVALASRGVTDAQLLSPPGFGAPVPDGFGCTRGEYRDWLVAEIEAYDAPVDLVGHDWGAAHVYAVVAARPDLVRSWAADCAGLLHPDYEWHDAAEMWQRHGDGEVIAELMRGLPPKAVVSWGASPAYASALASGIDAPMTMAMLALYRSAVQPAMRELGEAVTAAPRPPGLVIEPDGDPYVPAALSREAASRLGVDRLELPGCGHWWMWQAAERAADALAAFWAYQDGA